MIQQQEPSGFTPTGNPAGAFETWAEINLDNLSHNIKLLKKNIGNSEIMAILKANAYGLHAPVIFRHLKEIGVRYFGVANVREALQLRGIDADASILILGNVHPRFISKAVQSGLTLTVFSPEFWQILKQFLSSPLKIHIKLNTGFNRLGFSCGKESIGIIKEICTHPMIRCEGIFTHLALGSAENDLAQFELFKSMVSMLEAEGLTFPIKHIADSNAAVTYPWARLDLIRAGSAMYGLKASYPGFEKLDLKGVYKIKSSVAQVRSVLKGEGISYDYDYRAPRDMRIAAITLGYGDGYPRNIKSENAFVIIRGQKAALVGAVCMDYCIVDVSNIKDAEINDEVLVYDTDLSSQVSPPVVAGFAGMSKNSSFTSLTARVPKVYIKDGKRFALEPLSGSIEDL